MSQGNGSSGNGAFRSEHYSVASWPVEGTATPPPRCPFKDCPNSVTYWKENGEVKFAETCSDHREVWPMVQAFRGWEA